MSALQAILEHNRSFVENKQYEAYITTRFPNKKIVVVSCMDTRLIELLPKAMNLKNGDAKFIKIAGAIVTQPFGSVMRSILVAIYELNADEVMVVGHHECGMTGLNSEQMIARMKERGISERILDTLGHAGIDFKRWLVGFDNVHDGVAKSVGIIRNHPLLPKEVLVHGMIIDPETGKLEIVSEEAAGSPIA